MKCIFCKNDTDDWVDITSDIQISLRLTTTDAKFGYGVILFKNDVIGSFGMDGIKLYDNNSIDINGSVPIIIKDNLIVVSDELDGKPFYFRIFLKKKYA